jgi:hypothetical protein
MESQWKHLKTRAVTMRRRGASIREVERRLLIPRSTLSGWFKNIPLSAKHKASLEKRSRVGLVEARKQAVLWHNNQKAKRLELAKEQATEVLDKIVPSEVFLETTLAILYLAEGGKSEKGLVLGNSNPEILRFFIVALQTLYEIDFSRLRCELHLRADQKRRREILYWSRILELPETCFRGIYLDKRTAGKKTYSSYHGVCVVLYADVAIQRKLMYLYTLYCQRVIQTRG